MTVLLGQTRRLTSLRADFTSVTFNRAGNHIAFASSRNRDCAIYGINSDGTNLRQIVSRTSKRDHAFYDLQFSPDGTWLLSTLIEDLGEFSALIAIDIRTGTTTRLTHNRNAGCPRLSPDGRSIIFEAWEKGVTDLWRIDAQAGEGSWSAPIRLTQTHIVGKREMMDHPPMNRFPVWSPDGTTVAFLSSAATGEVNQPYQLCLMRADGSEVTRITEGTEGLDAVRSPVWQADGKRIAFTLRSDLTLQEQAKRSLWKYQTNLYVVNADGSNLRRLEESQSVNHLGAFRSQGGGYLAYSSSCEERFHEGKCNWDIRLVDVETGEVVVVTNNDVYDSGPLFSPDGNLLVFASEGAEGGGIGGCDLYSVTLSD